MERKGIKPLGGAYTPQPKDFVIHRLIVLVAVCLFTAGQATAEGSREILNGNCGEDGYIQIWDNGDPERDFATYGCDPENRLNVRIASPGEVIHFGFHARNNDLWWRLVDPNGNVVFGPIQINNQTDGYIQNCAEAIIGPESLFPGGYNDTTYLTTMAGDYYIEFAEDNDPNEDDKRIIEYFDVTVTLGNLERRGRLWSQAWDFTTDGGNNEFVATLYAYSNDSVVTSFDFNGMQPYGFMVTCNSFGASTVGNVEERRRSDFRQNIIDDGGVPGAPEYPIFLNDPDHREFPSGSIGEVDSIGVTPCSANSYCINVSATKPGNIDVLLEFPNGSVRTFLQPVQAGPNCVQWDGLDGNGDPVQNGTAIDIQVGYLTGLTHLPLIDVEDHDNGYEVELVRPDTLPSGTALDPPQVYWDDQLINTGNAVDGNLNLLGCDPLNTGGCHRWQNRGNNNNNPEVLNSWWYTNQQRDTVVFTVDSTLWQVQSQVNIGPNCIVEDTLALQIRFNNTTIDLDSVEYNFSTNFPSVFSFLDTTVTVVDTVTFVDVFYEVLDTTNINGLSVNFNVTASSQQYPYCETNSGESCVVAILPVIMAGMEAEALERNIELRWTTAMEENNRGFRVYRSFQGKPFEELTFVEGENQASSYTLTDPNLPNGVYYYRIESVDFDGTVWNLGPAVSARVNVADIQSWYDAHQNALQTRGTGELQVQVFDMGGRLQRNCGGDCATLPLQGLDNGVYIAKALDQAGHQHTYRFLLQR